MRARSGRRSSRAPWPEQHLEVRAHEVAYVERSQAPEQAVPYDGDEGGRDQQLRKTGERVVGEFAAFHRQREPRADDRQHARDDLAIVDLGELGKPRPFGDDQPDHVLAARAVTFVHVHDADTLYSLAQWQS